VHTKAVARKFFGAGLIFVVCQKKANKKNQQDDDLYKVFACKTSQHLKDTEARTEDKLFLKFVSFTPFTWCDVIFYVQGKLQHYYLPRHTYPSTAYHLPVRMLVENDRTSSRTKLLEYEI